MEREKGNIFEKIFKNYPILFFRYVLLTPTVRKHVYIILQIPA